MTYQSANARPITPLTDHISQDALILAGFGESPTPQDLHHKGKVYALYTARADCGAVIIAETVDARGRSLWHFGLVRDQSSDRVPWSEVERILETSRVKAEDLEGFCRDPRLIDGPAD